VDASDPVNISMAITPKTRLIWIETPSNPTPKIADIAAIASIAKTQGCLLCVDNTFASPALQKPIELGADIVVHSATKYIGGHSDLIAGLVVTANSLGDIKSLISHSAEMTHKTIPAERRRSGSVNDSLIRLSVGLEEPEDLIRDLCNSLDRIVVKKNVHSQKLETC